MNHLGFISSYSPIGDDEQGHYSAKPEYYGMLAFTLGGRGRMLKVVMDPNSPVVKAYATQPCPGALALTLIHKGTQQSLLTVNVGRHAQGRRASIIRLKGAALSAKAGITLGGAEVAPSGTWKPSKTEILQVHYGHFSMNLPPASAAIVHIS